jgi:hypothetical protein
MIPQCLVRRGVISLTLYALSAVSVHTAEASQPQPPPLSPRRHLEDYAYLRDPEARAGAWWEPFKYLPLQ